MAAKKQFTARLTGEICVDSGHIEIGDCGRVELSLPTRWGDGIFPVYRLLIDKEVVGYFINVDAARDWVVDALVDAQAPRPPVKKPKKAA